MNRVDQIGNRDAGSSRLVGKLPSGREVYVVATSKGRLCVVVAQLAESCGDPLTRASPLTFTVIDTGHVGEPPVAYGVARDGVASVSFDVGGRRVSVPIRDNFFAFEGAASGAAFSDVVATFANGTAQPAR